jgi:hypothetical protein
MVRLRPTEVNMIVDILSDEDATKEELEFCKGVAEEILTKLDEMRAKRDTYAILGQERMPDGRLSIPYLWGPYFTKQAGTTARNKLVKPTPGNEMVADVFKLYELKGLT